MKFCYFEHNAQIFLGVKTEKGLVKHALVSLENLWQGEVNLTTLVNENTEIIDENDVKFLPPVLHPPKILCVGLNYARHIEETKLTKPLEPLFFAKLPNALAGHKGKIHLSPNITPQVDYEGELVVVIGQKRQNIPKEKGPRLCIGLYNRKRYHGSHFAIFFQQLVERQIT